MIGRRSLLHSLTAAAVLFGTLTFAGTRAQALTSDEMYAFWAEAAERFESERTLLPAESEESLWVERVGRRIVQSWPDRRWVTHRFLVIDDPVPGAWSFPRSPVHHDVYVTTGLLEFIGARAGAQRDDWLAGVLGHEIAHLLREHHLLRHRARDTANLEVPEELAKWPALILGKWQKDDEFEADSYGAFYALHAGYRFDGVLQFLAQYMRKYGDDRLLDSVSDSASRPHPSVSARLARLRQERVRIEEAQRLFQCGLDLLRVGSWGGARACFTEVRDVFSLSPTVAHNLAYARLKQYENTVSSGPPLEQCVSTSYLSELLFKGPQTAAEQALLAEAKADFLKACELDRDRKFIAPRLGLACTYLYGGHEDAARSCLQEPQAGLDEPEYLNLTGVLAERRGDPAEAYRGYCKALHLNPNIEAGEAVQKVMEEPRPYLPALYNLARLLESQGNAAEAAQLYRCYLYFEGGRSRFGARARNGLVRCGGQLPEANGSQVVDSYRGIDLRSSGALVVEAALGEPEERQELAVDRGTVVLYEYPSQGITVALVTTEGDGESAVVDHISISRPNREAAAGVRIGDPTAVLQQRLGNPRSVSPGPGDSAWWDYARYGVAFCVQNGNVTRCLIGGRR